MFNINFNPIQFINSQRFSKQERHVFFHYFSNWLEIANSNAQLDLSLINIEPILNNLYLNQDSYEFWFFFYYNLFPSDYAYEDNEYEPYNNNMPVYKETLDFSIQKNEPQDGARQMNLAFDLRDEK